MRINTKSLVFVLVAILALAMTSMFSIMTFLPDHNVHPHSHPMHHAMRPDHAHNNALDIDQLHDRQDLHHPEAGDKDDKAESAAEVVDQSHAAATAENHSDGSNKKSPRYFMVFSTSCSPFQNWQGLAFFHFAKRVGQQGNVTRLVSGCKPGQAEELRKVHAKIVKPLSDRFHLHVTPDFDVKNNQKYWNKPHGLLDWMQQELGFPEKADEYKDDIIMIVDPDMMLLQPITHEFKDYGIQKWASEVRTDRVIHGTPIAQRYGYGASWLTSLKGNLSYVVGPDSPALKVSVKEAGKLYPAGPPYIAMSTDMYQIAVHWVKFLPRIHELFPEFMAEMHAYSTAAAHLELPHQLNAGFMVSDVTGRDPMRNEGFVFLQNTTRADACPSLDSIPNERLPLVLHYCQRYALGRWFFSKYKLREDFFDCKSPLMREPPRNVAEIYDWMVFPNGVDTEDFSPPEKLDSIITNGYMLCTIVYALNYVATEIKRAHCGEDANYEKTFQFHKAEAFQAMIDNPSNPFK